MPWTTPTLSQLQAQAQADVQSRIPGAAPKLRRSFLGAIAAALAGIAKGLYGFLAYLALQANPATATGVWLDLWCSLWGITRKQPSTATGPVDVTAAAPSTLILAGTQLNSTFGVVYSVQADVTTDGSGNATLSLLSTTTGAAANLPSGSVLTFISPIFGIPTTCVGDTAGIGGGADVEKDDPLRARMFQRVQNPPHGGNKADYEGWALSVAGITRAWCFPLYSGAGTVRIFIANDSYVGANTASSTDVTNTQNYINSVCPVTATPTVVAATITNVNFTLHLDPDTADNEAAVEAALTTLFLAEAVPEGTVSLNHMITVIGNAMEGGDFTVTAPSSSPTAAANHILRAGSFTFT